jgi:hypothetical protein
MQQDGLRLVVAVVIEELNEDQIIWRLYKLKGFLPDGARTDTIPVNPLHLDIKRSALTENGIFKYTLTLPCHIYNMFLL